MRKILRYLAVLLVLEMIVCLGTFVPVQAATITAVSPSSGNVGSNVTVSGTSAGATDPVTVKFDGNTVASTTASGSNWSASFSIPASTAGSHSISATDSANTATSSFNVTPKIQVSQTTTAVNINGTGFGNGDSITINVDSAQVTTTTAGSNGSWSASISSVAAGSHTFSASGSSGSNASTTYSVTSYSTIALGRTSGPGGTSVTINGHGFAANETGVTVTFDSTQVGTSTTADSTGSWVLTFTIPSASAGPHTIGAYGSTTTATSVPTQTFTITPGLTLNKSSAPPGATVTASGSGFVANETGINVTYDGNPIGTPATASATGTWTTTFVVPQGSAGTHSVGAYGANTAAGSVPVFTFTVGAGISISKTSGGAGTSVTVNGAGFGSGETGITVTYDGNPVGSPVTASATGSWSSTFTIPPSPAGAHTIGASGSVTAAASVPTVTFTSSASVTIPSNTTSGTVGTSLTLAGSGFASGDTVTITYDGNQIGTTNADNSGGWTSTIIIPPSAAGSHTIAVKGASTSASNLSFKVTPSVSTDSSSGYVGATVNISGSGFAANSALRFTYDDNSISNIGTVTTDANGGFTKAITIPVSKAGPHTIKIQDAQNNASSVSFNINSITLAVPNPISPSDGSKIGLTGNITPDFKWSPVNDPNGGVTYDLQIDTDPDFPHPLFDKPGLTITHYTLTKTEALPSGTYYWRVMATDAASNQSAWSQPIELQSGIISAALLIILIVIVIAAILVVLYILVLRPMQRRRVKEAAREAARAPAQAPEIVIPEVVNAEYRSIDPEDSSKKLPRALPWRLALPQAPQAAKGSKTLSSEDQARLKVIIDFAKSLPLIEPGNNTNWIVDLAESGSGEAASPAFYDRLLKGELQVRYEPAWMRHPTFMDLQTLLEGQPILQDLNSFVDSVNHSASEALLLLQDIYRDTTAEVTWDVLANNGWGFISGVYTDALSWFLGKYLREPSDRDYSIKPNGKGSEGTGLIGLYGEQNTPFAGLLVQVPDENEASQQRSLHLKLRRNYRNNDRAREVVSSITQLDVQRGRLLNAFSQFNRLNT